MKRIVLLFIFAAAAGCTYRQAGKSLSEYAAEAAGCTGQPDQALPENTVAQEPAPSVLTDLPDNVVEIPYPEFADTLTVGYRKYGNRYVFFGEKEVDGIYRQSDTLFPPIPGLVRRVCQVRNIGNGNAPYRFSLGLRCPSRTRLLEWMSAQVCENVFLYGVQPCPDPVSTQRIARYYTDVFLQLYKDQSSPELGPHNGGAGLLIADCWQRGDLVTFYKAEWSEWIWCKEYYYTMNALTGEMLTLCDLVRREDWPVLGEKMLPYLVNNAGIRYVDIHRGKIFDGERLLEVIDGAALIEEGLILLFPQFSLGSGADGQWYSVIPYNQISSIIPWEML